MGIDRIGKGAAPPATTPQTPAKGPAEASRPFEVRPSTAPAAPDAVTHATPLERLRSGQIDMNGYLDQKVEDATAHLHGLSAPELTAIRKMLRDQLVSDPALADLVTGATGSVPPPQED